MQLILEEVGTLGELCRETARACGELMYEGEIGTGSTTTALVDDDLGLKNIASKNLVGNWIGVIEQDDNNEGIPVRIASWDGENTSLINEPAVSNAWSDGANYIVTTQRIGVYADAVNRAIRDSFPYIVFPGDFTLTVVADTYTYSMPTDAIFGGNEVGPDYIARIWGDKDGDQSNLEEIPNRHWRVLPKGELWIHKAVESKYVDTDLIIEGYSRQLWLSWGSGEAWCYIPHTYIIPRASSYILHSRIGDKNAQDMSSVYYAESAQVLRESFMGPPANSRKVRNMILPS